jgi:hypothetical protein
VSRRNRRSCGLVLPSCLGVKTAGITEVQGLSFAVPSSQVREFEMQSLNVNSMSPRVYVVNGGLDMST